MFGKCDDPLGSYRYAAHLFPTKTPPPPIRRPLTFRLTRHNVKLADAIPVDFGAGQDEAKTRRSRKTVRFNLDCNVIRRYKVTADVAPIEQWCSSDELNASRCDGKLCAAIEPSARAYGRAFERAHRQVHADRMLTAAYLTELVKGLDLGYRGLEQYSSSSQQRKAAIRNHVASVIQCYRDMRYQSFSTSTMDLDFSDHGSVCSNRSGFSFDTASSSTRASSTTSRSLERTVRNHSAKLSSGNRHFATAMGKAEHLAAAHASRLSYSERHCS